MHFADHLVNVQPIAPIRFFAMAQNDKLFEFLKQRWIAPMPQFTQMLIRQVGNFAPSCSAH